MGRHGAHRIPVRELRRAHLRLLEAYESLLRDYARLTQDHRGPLDRASGGPSASRRRHRPSWAAPHLARGLTPMDVDTACEMMRDWGLLVAPGVEA